MKPLLLTALGGTALGLSACATLPAIGLDDPDRMIASSAQALANRTVPANLPPAARPHRVRGDTFIYGGTRVRRITAIDGRGIAWITEDGSQQHSGLDFFTPRTRYTTPTGQVDSTIDGDPGKLWPLAPGNKVSFVETRHTTWTRGGNRRSQTFRWECEVADMRMSYVPAGDFETFHVICRSYLPVLFVPVQVVAWDYAPLLGHYVRRTWFSAGKQRQTMLSAALPGKLATPKRIAAAVERLAPESGGI